MPTSRKPSWESLPRALQCGGPARSALTPRPGRCHRRAEDVPGPKRERHDDHLRRRVCARRCAAARAASPPACARPRQRAAGMVGFTERARRAGATFLLFVGLFPVALAVLMIPFLNHVPFEEAIARSWFTSGAALAGNPGGLCSHAGRRLCACVCARRLQQRPRACCVRAQRLLTDADLAGVEHHARLCKRDARAPTQTFGRVGKSARLGKI